MGLVQPTVQFDGNTMMVKVSFHPDTPDKSILDLWINTAANEPVWKQTWFNVPYPVTDLNVDILHQLERCRSPILPGGYKISTQLANGSDCKFLETDIMITPELLSLHGEGMLRQAMNDAKVALVEAVSGKKLTNTLCDALRKVAEEQDGRIGALTKKVDALPSTPPPTADEILAKVQALLAKNPPKGTWDPKDPSHKPVITQLRQDLAGEITPIVSDLVKKEVGHELQTELTKGLEKIRQDTQVDKDTFGPLPEKVKKLEERIDGMKLPSPTPPTTGSNKSEKKSRQWPWQFIMSLATLIAVILGIPALFTFLNMREHGQPPSMGAALPSLLSPPMDPSNGYVREESSGDPGVGSRTSRVTTLPSNITGAVMIGNGNSNNVMVGQGGMVIVASNGTINLDKIIKQHQDKKILFRPWTADWNPTRTLFAPSPEIQIGPEGKDLYLLPHEVFEIVMNDCTIRNATSTLRNVEVVYGDNRGYLLNDLHGKTVRPRTQVGQYVMRVRAKRGAPTQNVPGIDHPVVHHHIQCISSPTVPE